jgi:hypothetical protein
MRVLLPFELAGTNQRGKACFRKDMPLDYVQFRVLANEDL